MGEKIKLMSHLVAGFPTDEIALAAARALVAGGTSMLEVQLPFSDPSADGPAIQSACTEVLRGKYKTADGLRFVSTLRDEFPGTPIYIMSYGSLVYTPGVANFCASAAAAGASGLIIPDLPFDCDEGLSASCAKNALENIPVAAPSMAGGRLSKLALAGFAHIYAALRAGITGSETTIDDSTREFLAKVSAGGSEVYGGFGIKSGEQSRALMSSVSAVVAGSVFVRIISANRGDVERMALEVSAKAREICAG